MMNWTLITASIICSFSWISVSAAESQTVDVLLGEDINLTCSKMSGSVKFWFKVVNKTKAIWISTKIDDTGTPSYCDSCQNGKFNMRSNTSDSSLEIKQVELSDSGMYFCGDYSGGRALFCTQYLNVKGSSELHNNAETKSKKGDGVMMLMSVILGALTVFLLMVIIVLVVKNRKLQKAAGAEQNPRQRENPGSDELNYATVNFRKKEKK
ncbi:uncharacterized protein LOC121962269 isoform X1 [Plectropomus leopardus]|uniref:uncharacterized protein LOC121962269 isoform X1 n=1 Tax=Plectropomus leopardus TaxID=160734 RepID=UPI001C4D3537|nr:uncharacterized protein LOC121962269 isoform X1 [Plectropomus leopardus]